MKNENEKRKTKNEKGKERNEKRKTKTKIFVVFDMNLIFWGIERLLAP